MLQNTAAIRPLFFFNTFFSLGCVYQKCLLPRAFNKALLFHPGLSMTMTWFPWDFYGNWLILCNLIKALGSKFFYKKSSGWKYGALLKIGGLAATWQAGQIPLHREYRHTHTITVCSLFMDCVVFSPSYLSWLPQSIYAHETLYLSPCLSISLTHNTPPPNLSYRTLVK